MNLGTRASPPHCIEQRNPHSVSPTRQTVLKAGSLHLEFMDKTRRVSEFEYAIGYVSRNGCLNSFARRGGIVADKCQCHCQTRRVFTVSCVTDIMKTDGGVARGHLSDTSLKISTWAVVASLRPRGPTRTFPPQNSLPSATHRDQTLAPAGCRPHLQKSAISPPIRVRGQVKTCSQHTNRTILN